MEWRLDYSDSEIISETDSKTLVVSEIVWTPISDTDSVAKTAPGTISEVQPRLFRNWFRKRIPNQAFFRNVETVSEIREEGHELAEPLEVCVLRPVVGRPSQAECTWDFT